MLAIALPGGRRTTIPAVGSGAKDIAEIEIERDEASPFLPADFVNRHVVRAVKFLVVDGRDVMTGLAQNPGDTQPEILVELESHADFSMGSGT